jgi:serine/threonine-protein kinase HipA
MNAVDIVDREAVGSDELAAIKILLDAGSGSLGGARPKASVRDGDRPWMAKFPRASDEWDVMAWEMTALDLAEACGIKTPTRRLVDLAGKQVLLLERFDREVSQRIPYISAMTLHQAHDEDRREYIEIAEALQVVGSDVRVDLQEFWRRIAFSIAINNSDDHLRNHGLLYRDRGWRLSPAFDVNPDPDFGEHRTTSINFVTDHENAVHALIEAAEHFDLDTESANTIWNEVRSGVESWRAVAAKHGIDGHEIRLFSEAFENLAWPTRRVRSLLRQCSSHQALPAT